MHFLSFLLKFFCLPSISILLLSLALPLKALLFPHSAISSVCVEVCMWVNVTLQLFVLQNIWHLFSFSPPCALLTFIPWNLFLGYVQSGFSLKPVSRSFFDFSHIKRKGGSFSSSHRPENSSCGSCFFWLLSHLFNPFRTSPPCLLAAWAPRVVPHKP